LERGRWQPYSQIPLDHLRNHRLSLYGHNTGPDLAGHPRVVVNDAGLSQTRLPHQGGYQNNAMGVGGGTRVYGAQAWRFLPDDFRMASKYGVPEGSSLADWPISYEDLAPYYERAEWEIGVAGDSNAPVYQGLRQRGYPMPPVPTNLKRSIMERGAARLGWQTAPVPLLINSVPYQGRPGCVQCGMCVGFACPSESKNGTHNTMIPRALATGNCTLLTEAQVERITTDDQGRVTGVSLFKREGDDVQQRTIRANRVIVSSGAIESARLLLNSASAAHPTGLGNRYDQVGRNLQGHVYTGAFGLFDEETEECLGPGVSLSTSEFNHNNPGIIGGGMLANEFVKLPIIFWRSTLPPALPRWGLANKQHMRDYFRRTLQIYGPIQETPNRESRVTIDTKVKDRFGMPVARLSGLVHPESLRTADYMRARAEEWQEACGATHIWSYPNRPGLSGGQHQAGTCRMGNDPQNSVTDAWGRVHDHDNLFVIDGSLHVTNGGFNPVLTIMALAFRCAEHIAATM
jgi:choline dehydrogenase-like flavoprotein